MSGLFPSDAVPPLGPTYEEQAAELLAAVADALLGGRKDWGVLERLRDALVSPAVKEVLKAVPSTSTPTTWGSPSSDATRMLREVYTPKIEDEIHSILKDQMAKYYAEPPSFAKSERDILKFIKDSDWSPKSETKGAPGYVATYEPTPNLYLTDYEIRLQAEQAEQERKRAREAKKWRDKK